MKHIPLRLSDMQVLVSGRPEAARPQDIAVARGYAEFTDKGPPSSSERLTIMTERGEYAVGEEVRVIHVREVFADDVQVERMGPKRVYGEWVDGALVTAPAPSAALYDGSYVLSPVIDFFYDVTTYRFEEEGTHSLYWQPAGFRSNVLTLLVRR